MKKNKIIFSIISISFFIASCRVDSDTDKRRRDSVYQDSVKMAQRNERNDSLNWTDANGLRQGYWMLYGRDSKEIPFPVDMIWKEGRYVDGKEEGKWIEHSPSGNLVIERNYHEGKEVK